MSDTTNSVGGAVASSTEVDPSIVTDDTTNDVVNLDEVEPSDDDAQFDEFGNEIEPTEPDDDSEEVEYEDKKFRAPKGIKEALLRQADYTQKTQALAQSRKEFEASRDTSLANDKAYIDALATVRAYDAHLEQYKDVNWAALEQTDPAAAAQHWRIFQQLEKQRADAQKGVDGAKQRIETDVQTSRSKRADEVRAQLPKIIPNWSPELDSQIATYGAKQGYSSAELVEATLHNPVAASILHKAMQWDEHVSKTAKAKVATKQAAAQPAKEVNASPARVAPRDPSRMSQAAYVKWRQGQK